MPGSDTVTVGVSSADGGAGAPGSFTVTTAGLPVITAPASAIIVQGYGSSPQISIAEPGAVADETFTVTISDSEGLLWASGDNVTGLDSTSLTISGSLADVDSRNLDGHGSVHRARFDLGSSRRQPRQHGKRVDRRHSCALGPAIQRPHATDSC